MIDIEKVIELFKCHEWVKFIIPNCGEREYETVEFSSVIEILEKQLDNGWIPTSERLPEKDGEYLCTTVYGNVTDIWIDTFYKGEWTRPADVEFDYEIIAWQPLPEPYKEEEK